VAATQEFQNQHEHLAFEIGSSSADFSFLISLGFQIPTSQRYPI